MSITGWLKDDEAVSVPGLGESRHRVLGALREAGVSVGVVQLAARVKLHPSTTRFHLDALVDAGLVERASEDRVQPGRPRMLYRASPTGGAAGRRSYGLLAEILAGFVGTLTSQHPGAALQAGEAWGRYLADRPAPFQRTDAADATRQLVHTLDEVGFDPEPVTAGGKQQILLRHCPFREVAENHRDVVCSIHLGIMRGLLAELDAPLEARRLDAFVEPSLCVAHLAARSPARRRAS